jgi:hypothetical protein
MSVAKGNIWGHIVVDANAVNWLVVLQGQRAFSKYASVQCDEIAAPSPPPAPELRLTCYAV